MRTCTRVSTHSSTPSRSGTISYAPISAAQLRRAAAVSCAGAAASCVAVSRSPAAQCLYACRCRLRGAREFIYASLAVTCYKRKTRFLATLQFVGGGLGAGQPPRPQTPPQTECKARTAYALHRYDTALITT